MSNIWVVRAGRGGAYVDLYLERGMISIGMSERIGAEAIGMSRDELQDRTAKAHPEWSGPRLGTHVGQIHRFLADIKVGDEVATYDPSLRRYLLGLVTSEARWEPDVVEWQPYVRNVKWDRRVARDALSVESRNSLGAIQSLFRLNADASSELRKLAVPLSAPVEVEPKATATPTTKDRSLDDLRVEVIEKASEFIEDMIASLDSYQMQDFVAGLLRAMGYKTRVSQQGSDRGVDIFASPDGLGLQEPRIFVEVKHRSAPMGSQQIRAFMGGRRQGDRCLYVSTGGFTKDARYEAERSNVPLTLLDLRELGTLLVEHYEALDVETKRLVPLTKLYWPVTDG